MTHTEAMQSTLRRAYGSMTEPACARLHVNIMTSELKRAQQMRDRDIENDQNCLCAAEILRWRAWRRQQAKEKE
jgi:hypothetical protein